MTEKATPVSRGSAWLMAVRPKTLPAAISPVLVGTALAKADGLVAPLPALAALGVSLLLQIGANLANDYYDYVKGKDVAERIGPTRVAQSGLIPLPELRLGTWITFGLAGLVGLYLVSVGGWPILVWGLAAIVSAVAYTGGPFPLGYHGLGDLFVFVFFGLVAVGGTYYVQALSLTSRVGAAAVAVGALTAAILVVNNLRDIETDQRTGKRTLAVRIGPQATKLQYALLLSLSFFIPVLFWLAGWASGWVLIPWLTLPLAVRLILAVYRGGKGRELNSILARTARLDLTFSLLFAFGLML